MRLGLNRRQFAVGGAAVLGAAAALRAVQRPAYSRPLGLPLQPGAAKLVQVELTAAERKVRLPCFGAHEQALWTFTEAGWCPEIRLNLGDELEAVLTNRLPRASEITSIHWHGIRLPNDQDGVPHLVQQPVQVGETFRYRFRPPDCGTYFFHTHCNTVEQLGRGLHGTLIVDGDTTEPYDADLLLVMRDWIIDPDDGQFGPFFTLRGAGRAGTYGRVRSVNGMVNPDIPLPAGGDCRIRLLNTDTTRVMLISIQHAEAAIVAIDGVAVQPFAFTAPWYMAPGMRIDVVVRAPESGRDALLIDSSPDTPIALATFKSSGPRVRQDGFDPAPLRAARIPKPDLSRAELLRFAVDASSDSRAIMAVSDATGLPLSEICLSTKTFWTINQNSWPDRDHAKLPPPMATLERGSTYRLELKNLSGFAHPLHIHGHTLTFLSSNKRSLPPHQADTILLLPEETAEVAFVADNPGKWMFHCHVIEHQETGMMGYFVVT